MTPERTDHYPWDDREKFEVKPRRWCDVQYRDEKIIMSNGQGTVASDTVLEVRR